MRSRKPKPTRLKVMTGNPGKRPLNEGEPMPAPSIPDCPPELGPAAQREWDRLVGELGKLRVLTNLDRAALAAYCGASIANRQAEIMMRIASEFGFTPASRGRISVPTENEPDLFEGLAQQMKRPRRISPFAKEPDVKPAESS